MRDQRSSPVPDRLQAHHSRSGPRDSREGGRHRYVALRQRTLSLSVTRARARTEEHEGACTNAGRAGAPGGGPLSFSCQPVSAGPSTEGLRLGFCKANCSFGGGTSPKPTWRGGNGVVLFCVLCVTTGPALTSSRCFLKVLPGLGRAFPGGHPSAPQARGSGRPHPERPPWSFLWGRTALKLAA